MFANNSDDPVSGYIILNSGGLLDMHFSPDNITIRDIAQGLSLACRWARQGNQFYSVAQHSVLLYDVMRRDYPDQPFWALWALLHDASEAYLGDVPRPFKQYMPDFLQIEALLMQTIAEKFDLTPGIPLEVLRADHNIIRDEALVLFDHVPSKRLFWIEEGGYAGVDVEVNPWSWEDARKSWLCAMRHALERCGRTEIWKEEFDEPE